MSALDWVAAGVVVLSVAVGIIRGAVREAMGLAAWVVAFVVANVFAAPLAPLLPDDLPGPALRLVTAFLAVFLATLLVGKLVAAGVAGLLKLAGLGPVDRGLGGVYGLARAVAVLLALALLAGLTAVPREPFWRHSAVAPLLEGAVVRMKPLLPDGLARRLRYD